MSDVVFVGFEENSLPIPKAVKFLPICYDSNNCLNWNVMILTNTAQKRLCWHIVVYTLIRMLIKYHCAYRLENWQTREEQTFDLPSLVFDSRAGRFVSWYLFVWFAVTGADEIIDVDPCSCKHW